MTADERIEKLVNRFGQTIEDLPEIYDVPQLYSAGHTANLWHTNKKFPALFNSEDYICHLCDVIDRMEAALETAALWADCTACENISAVIEGRCISNDNYIIADRLLEGRHLNFDEPLMPVSTD